MRSRIIAHLRRLRRSVAFQVLFLALALFSLTRLAAYWRDDGPVVGSTKDAFEPIAADGSHWTLLDGAINLFLILCFILVARWAFGYARYALSRRTPTRVERHLLLTEGTQDDALARLAFAREVASTILSSPVDASVVVAIEGAWGEGKSTVIDWVERELIRERPHPIVIRFDPWPEDSKQGVVARLLSTISVAIRNTPDVPPGIRADVAGTLQRLSQAAARALPKNYSFLIRLVTAFLGEGKDIGVVSEPLYTLMEDRARLRECMRSLPMRLVVIADDLDRVGGEELRSILLAVNALSSFPNTNVVLAFDPAVVDSVLASQGFSDAGGVPFREKVVHVSFPLPLPLHADRRAMFERGLQQVLEAREITNLWMSSEAALREESLVLVLLIARSPRTLKRITNHFAVSLSRLQNEVHPADVLLLEALRAAVPSVWTFVRTHRAEFDTSYVTLDTVTTLRVRKPARVGSPAESGTSLLDLAVETSSSVLKIPARRVLTTLFPELEDMAPPVDKAAAEFSGRVSSGANLKRYFSNGVDAADISGNELRNFLEGSTDKRASVVHDVQSRGILSAFLSRAARSVSAGARLDNTVELVHRVLSATADEWRDRRSDVSAECAEFLLRVLATLPDGERYFMAYEVSKNTLSLTTSHTFLLDILKQANLWVDGRLMLGDQSRIGKKQTILTTSEILQLRDAWIQTTWRSGLHYIFEHEPGAMAIVFRLAQLEGDGTVGYTTVRASLHSFMESDEGLIAVVTRYSPQITGVPYAVDGLEKLIVDWPGFIRRVSSLRQPEDAIEKIREYAESLDAKA